MALRRPPRPAAKAGRDLVPGDVILAPEGGTWRVAWVYPPSAKHGHRIDVANDRTVKNVKIDPEAMFDLLP